MNLLTLKPVAPKLIISVILMITLLPGCAGNWMKTEKDGTGQKGRALPSAAQISPETRADFNAAMGLIKAREYGQGIALMTMVAERLKNNPVPYINLGMAYVETGNLKLAEENFRLALRLDPGNPVAGNEYALLYRKAGKFSEARQLYDGILKNYPDFYRAQKNLGILCDLYIRDYACAVAHYEIYSRAMPEDKSVRIWIADLKQRMAN